MNSAPSYEQDIRLAHVLADTVDKITMERFKALDLSITTKADRTLVSDADQAAEHHIRQQLKRARTRDAILGEEFGASEHVGAQRTWVVDPIDGTSNYVRGVPAWATLIGLMDNGVPVMGLVSAPAIGRRWWAAKGHGAWTGRNLSSATRINVSQVNQLQDASLSYSSLGGWEARGKLDAFLDLTRDVWRTRAFGDFWSYMMVAEGAVDFAAEPELALHDMVALVPIIEEAGGKFTSLDGTPGCFGGNALASNGLLHGKVLERLHLDPNAPELKPSADNAAPPVMLRSVPNPESKIADAAPAATQPTPAPEASEISAPSQAPTAPNVHGAGMIEADYDTKPIATQ